MISLKQPVINLSADDIVSIHSLLLIFKNDVIDDQTDILYQILKDLGPLPDEYDLLSDEDTAAANRSPALTRIENCLSLRSKGVPQEENHLEEETLRVIIKKQLLDVIRVHPEESVFEVLMAPAFSEEVQKHAATMKNTTVTGTSATQKQTISRLLQDHHLHLEATKEKIDTTLEPLTDVGLSKGTRFQNILHQIASDIKFKNKLRLQRQAEIRKIRQAVNALNARCIYYQGQIEQRQRIWNSGFNNILSQNSSDTNMSKKKEEGRGRKKKQGCLYQLFSTNNNVKEIKYTAAKLQKKGVIAERDRKTWRSGLQTIKFKVHHQLHVSKGKKSADLHLADILDLHYSRTPTMEIFSYDFNVSLLLFMVYSRLLVTTDTP